MTLCFLLLALLGCNKGAAKEVQEPRDTQAPELSITQPNLPYQVEGYSTKEATVALAGIATDDRAVLKVKWENDRGGKGVAYTKFEGNQTSWEVPEVKLEPGDNRITVTALDSAMNKAVQTIWVIRNTQIEFISFPDASETDIRLSEATEVIFRVAVQESAKVKIESVKLVKVNENNEVLDTLGTMYDDGKKEHGDEVPADGVFSAKVTLLEGIEGKVRFRVIVSGVKEGVGGVTALSEPFAAQVFEPVADEEVNRFSSVGREADVMYERIKAQSGAIEAGRRVAAWLKLQPGVVAANPDERIGGYYFRMESGLECMCFEEHPGGEEENASAQTVPSESGSPPRGPSEEAPPPKKTLPPLLYKAEQRAPAPRAALPRPRVVVASAASDDFSPDAYNSAAGRFRGHSCPAFDVERKLRSAASVEFFKTLKSYDVVLLDAHGGASCRGTSGTYTCPEGKPPADAIVTTFTGTMVSEESNLRYKNELNNGLIVKGTKHYGISPRFVDRYGKKSPKGALVYNGACRSFYNDSMWQAFKRVGVESYFGHTECVTHLYDGRVVNRVVETLLAGRTTKQALEDASGLLSLLAGSSRFVLGGNPDLKITIDGFNNGSFEDGTTAPVGWDVKGDVRVITKLGSITAKDGNWMAFLTTGEKSENETESSLSQPFCVPASVSKIAFDYRLVSEEPLEFVNSAWRDTFEASLDVAGAKTVLVAENTDKGPWSALPGVDFEGGDHTAFATDWRTVAKELPQAARTEGVTLAFLVKDGGDYIYDTSVLIDGVRME